MLPVNNDIFALSEYKQNHFLVLSLSWRGLNDACRDHELFHLSNSSISVFEFLIVTGIQVNLCMLCTCHQNSQAVSCDVQEIKVSKHVVHDFTRDQEEDVLQLIKQNEKIYFSRQYQKNPQNKKKNQSRKKTSHRKLKGSVKLSLLNSYLQTIYCTEIPAS